MSTTVTRHGTDIEMIHFLSNEVLRLGIRSGLDARIASIIHEPSGRELLKQQPPIPYANSAFSYGISTWVKAGEGLDPYSGVLNDALLPTDYLLSKRPRITHADSVTTYTAVHEAAGIRLEKQYLLPDAGCQFRMTLRLLNTTHAPFRLQLEEPLAWNTGETIRLQKFVLPTIDGLNCARVPDYDVTEVESCVLAEPWVAILDDQHCAEMIITLTGIERVSRLFYGTHGILCLYSPITELAPMGMIEMSQTFYYLTEFTTEAVPEIIAPLHARAQAAPSRIFSQYLVNTLSRWDTLLPRPQRAIRGPGSCPVSLTSVIAPASLAEEARLFRLQGAKAFPQCTDGMPIYLVEAPENHAPEAYTLDITPKAVTITGRPHGVWHGCQTLLDLLQTEQEALQAPCGHITDAPDLAFRGMLLSLDGPDWDVRLESFALHVLARLKLNAVAFPITSHLVKFDELGGEQPAPKPAAISASRLCDTIARIHAMHIEVLPLCGITPSRDFGDALTAQNDALLEDIIATCQPQRLNIRFQHLSHVLLPSAPTTIPANTDKRRASAPGDLDIHPDDLEHVAFLKLIHRYYQFLHKHGVQMVLCTDFFNDWKTHNCPLLIENSGWLLERLPDGIILQEVTNVLTPSREFLTASLPWAISSPMPMPQHVREHSQVLAREGGLGLLPWGGELSPDCSGAIEGVIWSAMYGWRANGLAVDEARILIREHIDWIVNRHWE